MYQFKTSNLCNLCPFKNIKVTSLGGNKYTRNFGLKIFQRGLFGIFLLTYMEFISFFKHDSQQENA